MHISAYASRGFPKLTKQPQKGLADRGFNVEPLMALARETGNLGMTVGGPREEHHQDDNKQESDQTEEPVTQEHDPPMESLLARGTTEDHWRVATGFFFRVHMKPRTAVYTPSADDFPGDINRVSHARVTHKSFQMDAQVKLPMNGEWFVKQMRAMISHGRGIYLVQVC